MKIKKYYKGALKYISLFFVCLVLSNAKILNVNPFLIPFLFACIYVGIDEKIISTIGVVCYIIVSPTLQDLFVVLSAVAVMLICFYIHRLAKRKIKLWTIFLTYVVSLVMYIFYNYLNYTNLAIYIFLGLLSLFVFIVVMQVVMLRKNCFKLTLDESICFLFFIALIGIGLSSVTIWKFELYRIVAMVAILICIAIGSHALTYSTTLAFSFGVALSSASLIPVAEFLILGLVCSIFSMPNKYKIVFMSIITDIFIQYFFVVPTFEVFYQVVPIIIAGIIFVCVPNKSLNALADIVYVKKSEMSSRNLINTTRKNIRKRMSELSNVFLEMKHIHLNMIKKELTKEELVNMFIREITCTCCKDCLDKNRCNRSLGTDNKSNLQAMVEVAVNKGKITLLDIPSGLTNRCGKVNYLISLINRLTDEYRQYKNIMADVNNVKILLADQMGAVSKLLINLGDEIDTNVRFDIARENKIISRLLNSNIQCREVLLYTEKNDDISAVLIIKGENAFNPVIEKVLTETMKCQMQITKVTPLEESDFSSVELKKKSKYDCVFGLASCNKSGNSTCGDCHSIIRLGGDRFLLALCDGMGSGESAHKMSAMTLGLIENFYKVGFDNDIILDSVNKLLAINNQENYSTLDVCLLDLDREIADFIKVGAPFGLIKRTSNIEIVEGGSLPIGAMDSISPATHKTTIGTKDIVVLCTDGITDAFETEENLIEFVSKLASTNPQTLAETILNEALRLNNMSARDDMTVLVARTYLKS